MDITYKPHRKGMNMLETSRMENVMVMELQSIVTEKSTMDNGDVATGMVRVCYILRMVKYLMACG